MNEKELIKGTLYNTKLLPLIGTAVAIISFIYSLTKDTVLPLAWFWIVGLPIWLITLFIYWWIGMCQLVITDKRVYGKTAFGKQVDLPLDLISAVGTVPLFIGVGVYTSSGRIVFYGLKNAADIFTMVSELLKNRQDKMTNTMQEAMKKEIPQSDAEELKKYKELLDSGVITQEEFDAKKKQLLGL